ncbi:ATPase [Pandoraea terrae]|uniref:ATPase n=1 Tax=Pandoraea terrae TaxID=1537710 RepID=A0A5E4UT16_9BURK|nr:MoxR family ATPase [Pandoraea terrae]VVE02055.1 ATPase [Pandoraea terrae]
MPDGNPHPASVDAVLAALADADYLATRQLATTVFLGLRMGRPLFLEGEAGVGKTEVARALAAMLDRDLIRLQCFEGLDIASAAYEWDYARQVLEIRLSEAAHAAGGGPGAALDTQQLAGRLYGDAFLLKRPLAQALMPNPRGAPVLLIDELDRADEPFDAFLLEVLSEFQLSIPEFGTLRAATPPVVVITSNRTREIHDAIKRRCLYHWVDYPDARREWAILRRKVPDAPEALTEQVVAFVQRLREGDLYKAPGVAETLDWTRALMTLDCVSLDADMIDATLGALLKYQDDLARVQGDAALALLRDIQAGLGGGNTTP